MGIWPWELYLSVAEPHSPLLEGKYEGFHAFKLQGKGKKCGCLPTSYALSCTYNAGVVSPNENILLFLKPNHANKWATLWSWSVTSSNDLGTDIG